LQYIPSGLAAIIAAMVPLFVALFSILLQNFARLSKMMFAGLGIGFLGILTIFYQHLSSFANPDFVLGIVLACIVTVSWSIGTVYASKHNPQINLLFAVGLQMLIAGIIMMSISYITGYYTDITQANTDSLISLAYLIVVGSLITYSAYVFAVSKLPPTLVSVYAYINPVVALFAGWIILKEELGLHALAGTMIVLLGIFLVNRGYKKQQHAN
jgi:drug/metabolite transporter (DMT)-like permease